MAGKGGGAESPDLLRKIPGQWRGLGVPSLREMQIYRFSSISILSSFKMVRVPAGGGSAKNEYSGKVDLNHVPS